jgi:hypothetical protein
MQMWIHLMLESDDQETIEERRELSSHKEAMDAARTVNSGAAVATNKGLVPMPFSEGQVLDLYGKSWQVREVVAGSLEKEPCTDFKNLVIEVRAKHYPRPPSNTTM